MTPRPTTRQVLTRLGLTREHLPAALAVAFVLGLVTGWWLLGWVLFPVKWIDARPADLEPGWQRVYLQLVAEKYAGGAELTTVRKLLDEIDESALTAGLSELAYTGGETARQDARQLAQALGIHLATPRTATSQAPSATPPGTVVVSRPAEEPGPGTSRTLALTGLAIIALAVGAALSWGWLQWRQGTPGPSARQSTTPLEVPEAAARPTAPPWRPERIDLGSSVTAHYDAGEDRYYQTWLLYDERGGLVGGAGLQAQSIGNVNTLELWFFERDDEGEDVETPMVTFVSRAAHADKLFRARLGDRNVVPVVPGQRVTLETADLTLVAEVQAVEPDPHSQEFSLQAVTLSLTPLRSGPAEDGEPPIPLPFRRD